MADYTEETVITRTRRWIVPTAGPWGAPAAEIGKAWSVAEHAYREHHGIPKDQMIPDNALTFHPGDDAVVIQFSYDITE